VLQREAEVKEVLEMEALRSRLKETRTHSTIGRPRTRFAFLAGVRKIKGRGAKAAPENRRHPTKREAKAQDHLIHARREKMGGRGKKGGEYPLVTRDTYRGRSAKEK